MLIAILIVSLLHFASSHSPVSISWDPETLSTTMTSERWEVSAAIYNDSVFIIGGDANNDISQITIDNLLNGNNNSSLWIESLWQSDSSTYGSISYDMRSYSSHIHIGSLLYMLGLHNNYGTMLLYDLSSRQQVDASTYHWSMPYYVSAQCYVLYTICMIECMHCCIFFCRC